MALPHITISFTKQRHPASITFWGNGQVVIRGMKPDEAAVEFYGFLAQAFEQLGGFGDDDSADWWKHGPAEDHDADE